MNVAKRNRAVSLLGKALAFVLTLGVAVPAMAGHYRASPYTGPWREYNCGEITKAFADPPRLLLAQLRNNPRQADDFVRNLSKCRGTNIIGWSLSTEASCALVEQVDAWLHKYGIALTGRGKPALTFGFWGSSSGNSADLANNANDCLTLNHRYFDVERRTAKPKPGMATPAATRGRPPERPAPTYPGSAPRPPAPPDPSVRVWQPTTAAESPRPSVADKIADNPTSTVNVYDGGTVNIFTLSEAPRYSPPRPTPISTLARPWRDGLYY